MTGGSSACGETPAPSSWHGTLKTEGMISPHLEANQPWINSEMALKPHGFGPHSLSPAEPPGDALSKLRGEAQSPFADSPLEGSSGRGPAAPPRSSGGLPGSGL